VGHVPRDVGSLEQLRPLQARFDALQLSELVDAQALQEVRFLLEELRLKTFNEALTRQRVEGAKADPRQWKVSIKRMHERLLSEERSVGLA